jgi:ribosomal protein S18 acetylase RimI-like enzyme
MVQRLICETMSPQIDCALISVRVASEDDNEALLDLEKICPEGTELVLQFDRSPAYFFRSGVCDHFDCYVAEEDGRIVGTVGAMLKQFTVGGEVRSGLYIRDLRVHPAFRRRSVASSLVQHAMLQAKQADLAYALVMENNDPSIGLFRRLGYQSIRDLTLSNVPLYKRQERALSTIREITPEDLPRVVHLINEHYRNYDFYPTLSVPDFLNRTNRLRKCGLRNVLVAEADNRIVACAGLWDYSRILRATVLQLTMKLNLLSHVLSFFSHFMNVVKLPSVGEELKLTYVTDFAHAEGSLDQVADLVEHCLTLANGYGSHFLCFPFDASDPMLPLIRKYRAVPVTYHLYAKNLKSGTIRTPRMIFADPMDF